MEHEHDDALRAVLERAAPPVPEPEVAWNEIGRRAGGIRRRRRVAGALLGAVVLGAGVAGAVALDRDRDRSADEEVVLAASRTREAGTAEVRAVIRTTGPGIDLEDQREGVVDFEHRRALYTYVQTQRAPDEHVARGKIIVDGEVLYASSEVDTPLGPLGADHWVKLPVQRGRPLLGFAGPFIGQLPIDPANAVSPLEEARDVESLGREHVNGVDTEHFRFEVSLPALPSAKVEVWVDDDHLARRVRLLLLPREDGSGLVSLTMVMTIDFLRFGVDVDIELPPPDRVADLFSGDGSKAVVSSGDPLTPECRRRLDALVREFREGDAHQKDLAELARECARE